MRPTIDDGRPIDWGETSGDYAIYRPGPPEEFFSRLVALGVGLPGQRVLDLGTGTGVIARGLARRGARLTGIDVAKEQIEQAGQLARSEGLEIQFLQAPAEEPPVASHCFEAATANQCFLYFDKHRVIASLRRVLVAGGCLVTSHFNWLPRNDVIARSSEELVLSFNPSWQGADYDGNPEIIPDWAPSDLRLEAYFEFDVDVPFNHQTWRGRIRASRGIGASLPPQQVAAFDVAHAELLQRIAPPAFTIRHRIDARILRFP